MKTAKIVTMTKAVEKFRNLLTAGLSSIREACEIYVQEIDSEPSRKAAFISACPEVPPGAWSAFEMVGRNAMDYRLLWGGGKAQAKLRRLAKSDQQRLLDSGVEIAVGKSDKRVVPVELLDKDDIDIVFAGNRVRTVDEQRVVISRIGERSVAVNADNADYYVSGGKLVVLRAVKIPLRTIRMLVER